jgi:transcriptional regulator with XRE-family HTH domain
MATQPLIAEARRRSKLTQAELAARAGTSRPTLSAYEHGRVSPTLDTVERIVHVAGQQLTLEPLVGWHRVALRGSRFAWVPSALPRLTAMEALRRTELPLHLNWSTRARTVDLAIPRVRARCYESVLREGRPSDIAAIVDGALLVDIWEELVLPRALHRAWQPIIDSVRSRG